MNCRGEGKKMVVAMKKVSNLVERDVLAVSGNSLRYEL